MTELTAAAPRFHWDARRVGAGVGAALGLALVAFASGGYFPTAWTWAALIALVFVGALLALGFASRAQTVAARAVASGTLPIFLATLYFTFSRGAWIAGAVGLVVALAIDPGRLQLLLTGLVLGIPSGLAVLLSSHQEALTRTDAPISAASDEGHRLAVYILMLAVAAGLGGAGLWLAERRVTPPRQARLAFAGAAALVLVVGVLGAFVHYGGPVELVRKGYDSFTTTSENPTVNLNQRLFTFSGSYRAELWHAAWHDYQAHPVLGSGPGTYEWYWDEHRPLQHKVRDAHNLYLEVLAETGPVGLLLLILALGTPLVAAFRARGHSLVPFALAAFVAFLVHATVDWDWEMSAVTLAALACAAALLTAATSLSTPILSPRLRAAGVVASLLLAVLAFVGVVGSSALAASDRALTKGDYPKAASQARKASKWWRWSPDPWRELGDIAVARNDSQAARTYYRKAISKDDTDWKLWYDLSTVSNGAESNRALARAVRLNRYARSDFEAGDVPG